MSLRSLWESDQNQVTSKKIQQLIGFAGDGHLKDSSVASREFREFLDEIPTSLLRMYSEQCLESKFDQSGFALQDVVNQMGKRLGYQVEFGRYRGVTGEVGFDGLWRRERNHSIIVEVKTTDAYRINLDTIANYRRQLISMEKLDELTTSILIVVGRQDTGDLEAQVRGSRYAWDTRIIGVEKLLRLLELKEKIEEESVLGQIRSILQPRDFTRLDEVVDLVFSAADDVEEDIGLGAEEEEEDGEREEVTDQIQKKFTPGIVNEACASKIAKHLNVNLIRDSRVRYATPDGSVRVLVAVSKEYLNKSGSGYWFAFHPHQQEWLQNSNRSYVGLGCGVNGLMFLFPFHEFDKWKDSFHVTQNEKQMYWHIRLEGRDGSFEFRKKKGAQPIDATKYRI